MSGTPSASTRWPCWPARSSASTRSSGRHGHEASTIGRARPMMQECEANACVGACSRHLVREAGAARPSGRRGMASVSPPSRGSSCRPEAGRRHQACCRGGAGFHLKGRYRGWISCRGGCGRGTRSHCWTAMPTRGCGRTAAGRSVHRRSPLQGIKPAGGNLAAPIVAGLQPEKAEAMPREERQPH
jgi:hypothetical protein